VITPGEVHEHAKQWGVSSEQMHKDHTISHVLEAIVEVGFSCWFYGGTALNRSYLSQHRLSEDIDLMVEDIDVDIGSSLGRRLLRGLGDTQWNEASRGSWMRTYNVVSIDAAIKVQLVRVDRADRLWGWAERPIELRYGCLPENLPMLIPEVEGFVAMKLSAYTERWAPRDLLDLAGMAELGFITPAALARYRKVTGRGAVALDFAAVRKPTRDQWQTELGHQLADPGDPQVAVELVRLALATALKDQEA